MSTAAVETTDLVVVGSGAAGFAAAITARRAGLDVLLLEKRDRLGGTTARSGTWIWVPNNRLMREAGIDDPRQDALRYMARLSRPDRYVAGSETLGLPPEEYDMLGAFYDHAADALDELADAGALDPVMRLDAPDYFAELPEDTAPYGRVIVSRGRERPDQLTGPELIADFEAAALRLGVRIEAGTRVLDVVGSVDRVEGVVADRGTVRAHRGVVFATGGFARDDELLLRFVRPPIRPTGAADGAEGDFLRIGMRLGARLRNMSEAWLAPLPIEQYLADPTTAATSIFAVRGDSMILVNSDGVRVANEKLPYHELASVFQRWDPAAARYPNIRLFMIFDDATRRLFADGKSGNPLPLDGVEATHVVSGDTWEELARRLDARLEHGGFAVSAGVRLAPGFRETVRATVERFNADAVAGVDAQFRRGGSAIELFRNGPPRKGNDRNPAMHPFEGRGPYHAIILAAGTLDTKGGPATDSHGRVLVESGRSIEGLYAAGNCAGFPSGRSYWAGGATVGLAITFGWRAARHAAGGAATPASSVDAREAAV